MTLKSVFHYFIEHVRVFCHDFPDICVESVLPIGVVKDVDKPKNDVEQGDDWLPILPQKWKAHCSGCVDIGVENDSKTF